MKYIGYDDNNNVGEAYKIVLSCVMYINIFVGLKLYVKNE